MSNDDNFDHNKLRVYKLFKSSFNTEPYISIVRNRNQRSSLGRSRISVHGLTTELGRRTRPVTPFSQRVCVYCQTNQDAKFIDTEIRFLLFYVWFQNSRNCLFTKILIINPLFPNLTPKQKFFTLMCQTTPMQTTKLVNRFEKRVAIDTL